MRSRFDKKVFTPEEVKQILPKLRKACELGFIEKRRERNRYLKATYRGVVEKGISDKWNVKVYTYNDKKRGHSVVCIDHAVLRGPEVWGAELSPPDQDRLGFDPGVGEILRPPVESIPFERSNALQPLSRFSRISWLK